MAQQTFTREEVINKLNVLLEQNAPSLMDAITNEHTDFDGEELLILAEQTTKPMAQQTAVEWFFDKLKNHEIQSEHFELYQQAKKIEREQSKQDYDAGLFDGTMVDVKDRLYKNAEQYYNETYGK